MSFQTCLNFGKIGEKIVKDFLESEEYYAEPFIVRDEFGNEIGQIIFYNGKSYRCPDFEVYSNENKRTFYFRVEVKSLSDLYKQKYLIIEKYKFVDYYRLQQAEDVECRIIFVIGKADTRRIFYWNRINNLLDTFVEVVDPYNKKKNDIHLIWETKSFLKGLNDFVPF